MEVTATGRALVDRTDLSHSRSLGDLSLPELTLTRPLLAERQWSV